MLPEEAARQIRDGAVLQIISLDFQKVSHGKQNGGLL